MTGDESLGMRGRGTREDPFVLPACSNDEAIFAVLRRLRDWEKAVGCSWKVLEWAHAEEGNPALHRVRFLRRQFAETEVHTDRMAFYYDFGAVSGQEVPPHSPLICPPGQPICFPNDLAWLHFDRMMRNSAEGEPMDYSLFYSGERGVATIYIYGTCDPDDQAAIEAEADKVIGMARSAYEGAETPWPRQDYDSVTGQFFLIDGRVSFAGVAARGGKFVKLRLTMKDEDEQSRDMLRDFLDELIWALDGRAVAWVPKTAD